MMEKKKLYRDGASGSGKDFRVDLAGVNDRQALFDRLAKCLPLPDYCGANLDALYDVLTECGSWESIRFENCREADRAMPGYMDAFREMCGDVCAEWDCREITFLE